MRFRASNTYDYYRPSKCAKRVALRHREIPETNGSSPFDELLARLGERHERAHLATYGEIVDLSSLDGETRERETVAAIRTGARAIYQARFRAIATLDGEPCEVLGLPDFLIRAPEAQGYIIRDSKLARRVDERRHVEITIQLQLYGWLYEEVMGEPPVRLEVHSGSGELISIPQDNAAALSFLRDLRTKRLAVEDAYEPVGWTKCNGCCYRDLCGRLAERTNDIALLPSLTEARAIELRGRGIATIAEIPAAIENDAFRDLFYEGKKKPRLRDSAVRLLRSAEAHLSGKHVVISSPQIPSAASVAILDFEGIPPYADDLEKIYLWGVKVFGSHPSRYLVAQAGFGPHGDRDGWFEFLRIAAVLLQEYGDLRFVHWSPYERTKIKLYLNRFGDHEGIAVAMLDRLFDLYSAVTNSVVLPLRSYGLKVVEEHIGFRRKLSETDGTWAIARYIEATETIDRAARDQIMRDICAYNEEDLAATWAVLQWVKEIGTPPEGSCP